MPIDRRNFAKLRALMERYETLRDLRKLPKRMKIFLENSDCAPICILCRNCEQTGFLFHCTQFELPEDGKIVGDWGNVFYYRRGHKPRAYPDVPIDPDQCELFEPLPALWKLMA